jgi:protein TonB
MTRHTEIITTLMAGMMLALAPAMPASNAVAQDQVQRTPTHVEAPRYPRGAERRHIEGSVTITYSISADGEVLDAAVTAADPEGVFDRAGLAAVNSWTFEPHAEQTDGHVQQLEFALD